MGYSNLTFSKLVEFRIHGVSLEYIRELDKLGYRNIDPDQLVELRIFGVSPEYIRRIKEKKGSDPSIRELINRKIHGSDWDD